MRVLRILLIVIVILAVTLGVALLKNIQNMQNQPNIMPGIEQPEEIDVFEDGELGAPMETPDAPEEVVPEPITPDTTDNAIDIDPNETVTPDPANQ